MNKAQKTNKKEYAKALFLAAQHTQEEIGDIIGISRQTLSKWIKKEKWDDLRRATTLTPEKIITQLNKQLDEINQSILSREEGKRFATSREADAILKISNTIKNLQTELGLNEVVSVSISFLSWLRDVGEVSKNKEIANLFNMYINDLANKKAKSISF